MRSFMNLASSAGMVDTQRDLHVPLSSNIRTWNRNKTRHKGARGSVRHMVSRIYDHQRGWNTETRVVCEGHPVVHKSENLGGSSHLTSSSQIIFQRDRGVGCDIQLISDLCNIHPWMR